MGCGAASTSVPVRLPNTPSPSATASSPISPPTSAQPDPTELATDTATPTLLPARIAPTSTFPSEAIATLAATESPSPTPSQVAEPEPSGIVKVEIAEGSIARYLVREQLARFDLPNDAVGETSTVVGLIKFDSDGGIDSGSSKITVDLRTLKSDEGRRDRYLRTRSLESDVFPLAELVVKELPGLDWPLPQAGETSFQIVGDMTLHGVTRPVTWEATAQFFEDSVVLSVDETMRFELDFLATVIVE